MHVEAWDKMHRIIQEAFAEIARRMRANEPTTEWDIGQYMLHRYKDEGMQEEPMIVAVNANTANPHYMPIKEKNSPIRRGDFVRSMRPLSSTNRKQSRLTKPGPVMSAKLF